MTKLTRNQRRQLDRLAPHVDRIVDSDIAFFKQHPDRRHRVRHTGEAELAELEVARDKMMQPPQGQRWFTIVRKIPGGRIRVFVSAPATAGTDLAVPEDLADALFETVAPPQVREVEASMCARAASSSSSSSSDGRVA